MVGTIRMAWFQPKAFLEQHWSRIYKIMDAMAYAILKKCPAPNPIIHPPFAFRK